MSTIPHHPNQNMHELPAKQQKEMLHEGASLKEEDRAELEDQLPAYLEHAHSPRPGNLAEGTRAPHAGSGIAQVNEVEDVVGFSAELEADALVNGEVPEKRGINILVSRPVQRS